MATTGESLKVTIDLGDVVIKRKQEIDLAKQAEREKIAAYKREAAARVREDKEAWALQLAAAKKAAAEQEAQAKYLASVKARSLAAEQRAREALIRTEERAAKGPSEWTIAVKAQTEALNGFKGQVNQSGEALGKLAAGVSALSPEVGALVAGVQKGAGVLSAATTAATGFGAGLGTVAAIAAPLALVIGGLVYAWNDYEEAQREAAEAQDLLLTGLKDVSGLVRAASEETDKLAVKIGLKTEAQYEDEAIERKWQKANEDATASLRAQRDALIATASEVTSTKSGWAEYNTKLADLDAALQTATTAMEQGIEAGKANAMIAREEAESEEVLRKRKEDGTKATKDATEAEKELAEARALLISNTEAAYQIWLRDEQAKADARKQAFEAAEQEKKIDAERRDREQAAAARMVKLEREKQAAIQDTQDAMLASIASYTGDAASIANSIGDVFGTILDVRTASIEKLQDKYDEALEAGNDAQAAALQKQIEAEQEAALKTWRTQQALALTAAILDGLSGVSKAAASAPPPFNLIPIAAATATGAANVAAVAAAEPPAFDDAPQVMQAQAAKADTRVNMSVKNGDLVAVAQTPRALERQVAGMNGGGRREIVTERMNRQLAGRTMTSDLQRITRGYARSA